MVYIYCNIFAYIMWLLKVVLLYLPFVLVFANLEEDLQDLSDMFPFQLMEKYAYEYIKEDKEYGKLNQFLLSSEWNDLVEKLQEEENVQILEKTFLEYDIDLVQIFKYLNGIFVKNVTGTNHSGRSVNTFVNEINWIIPTKEIREFIEIRYCKHNEFRELYHKVVSADSYQLTKNVINTSAFKNIQSKLEELNVPVGWVIENMFEFLGWKSSKQSSTYYITCDNIVDINVEYN